MEEKIMKESREINQDLESLKYSLQNQINKKVDSKELDKFVEIFSRFKRENIIESIKNELSADFQILKEDLSSQRSKNDAIQDKTLEFSAFKQKSLEEFNKLKNNLKKITENFQQTQEELKKTKLFLSNFDIMKKEIDETQKKIEEKVSKDEFIEIQQQILLEFQEKNKENNFQNQIKINQNQIMNYFQEFKEEIKVYLRAQETEIYNILCKKTSFGDISKILESKADSLIFSEKMSQISEMKSSFEKINKRISFFQEKLDQKANIKDVYSIIEGK